jgi:hypothetical protein
MPNSYSPETQAMANLLPDTWRLRQDPFSTGQQFLNPIGNRLTHLREQIAAGLGSMTLEQFPLKALSRLYRVYLGDTFQFAQRVNDPRQVSYELPEVSGTIGNSTIPVTLLDSLEKLETSLPTRLSLGTAKTLHFPVLAPTAVSSLSQAQLGLPTLPGHLYIKLSGVEFAGLFKGQDFYPNEISLTGMTTRGLIETETILMPGNYMVRTAKRYSRPISVRARYIQPGTATLTITDTIGTTVDLLDPYFTINVDRQDRYVLWNLDDMILSRQYMDAMGLQAPFFEMDIAWQLCNPNGQALSGSGDLAFIPYSNTFYVLNNNTLLLYDKRQEYPAAAVSLLKAKTDNCLVVLDADNWNVLPGDTVKLRPVYAVLGRNVRQFRYRVAAPGGSFTPYVKSGNTLVPGSDKASWIYTTPSENILPRDFLGLTLNQSGYWAIALDVTYDNDEMSTDIRLVGSLTKSALTSLPLPGSLGDMSVIAVDDSNGLWVSDDTDAYQINLYRDYAIMDFDRRLLYSLERYDSIEVTP